MPYKAIPGIYSILNKRNGKLYIGSAISTRKRMREHKGLLRKNQHFNLHLQAAWNKYSENSFVFSIEELCDANIEILLARENFWIKAYKANERDSGYNKRADATTNIGVVRSDETRLKLSISHLGHKRTKEANDKIVASMLKPVAQHTLDGKLIKVYPSMKEAAKELGIHRTGISMCISGKINQTGGFTWKLVLKHES